ncbi:MAG TPA: Mut7-C RNAse domain-containing protein [Candidatus Binataceae bacterium]|nr:Mut7-C RNAse domain-containing protein [Candidatus Binataceae bacterium]
MTDNSNLSRHPEPPKFAADLMLGRLARWLRLMGADVIWGGELHGHALVEEARRDQRVILTRDKRLRTAPDALFIESNYFREQIRQVLGRFPFDPRACAFTRCSECNQPLIEVSRELVRRRVPPFVYASHETFAECEQCGRVYWGATHLERALRELESLGL